MSNETGSMNELDGAIKTPRERVASLIEAIVARDFNGEQIIQMIERQTLGFAEEEKKLIFFYSVPQVGEAA